MRIAGLVVLYNPTATEINNILELSKYVNFLLILDNSNEENIFFDIESAEKRIKVYQGKGCKDRYNLFAC